MESKKFNFGIFLVQIDFLHGISLSVWPVHIFHHKDSRRNLELNIGDGHGGPGICTLTC